MTKNTSTTIIAPSILAANFGRLEEEIVACDQAGADWIHIDVMDGSFVPPITFGANVTELAKRLTRLPLDVHLMIERPGDHIDAFADAGADYITIHQEACRHTHRVLGAIRKRNVKSGISINPGTPAEAIFPVLDEADLVLVMTVNPGWGGQSFLSSCLHKIDALRNEIEKRGLTTLIEVDGGIQADTGALCKNAGAEVLVAGTYIFKSENRKAAIESLR